MQAAVTVIALCLVAAVGASTQCFTLPSPSGPNFLQVRLETTSPLVTCRYSLFAPYNTKDILNIANSTIVLQLVQPSIEFCCSSATPRDYNLIATKHPYFFVSSGHLSPNTTLVSQVQIPFNAYINVRNEADFNFVLPTPQPTTLTVVNTSLSANCGVQNPYLSIYGAVGGGEQLDVPFDTQMNVSAQDQSFTLTVVPVLPNCTAPIKLSLTSATFVAPPSSCYTIQAYSNKSCSLPCTDPDAFVCQPGLQGILNVFTPRYSNISVTVTPTSFYPIQCFAGNKQVAGEGNESGWFVALANTTTSIMCSVVGAIFFQPPWPTWQITTRRVPFSPPFTSSPSPPLIDT